jgi:hypothetical protein
MNLLIQIGSNPWGKFTGERGTLLEWREGGRRRAAHWSERLKTTSWISFTGHRTSREKPRTMQSHHHIPWEVPQFLVRFCSQWHPVTDVQITKRPDYQTSGYQTSKLPNVQLLQGKSHGSNLAEDGRNDPGYSSIRLISRWWRAALVTKWQYTVLFLFCQTMLRILIVQQLVLRS